MKKLYTTLMTLIFISNSLLFAQTWKTYNISDGLANNLVTSMMMDSQGNKWFGSLNALTKFDGTIWTAYTSSNGLPVDNRIITSIVQDDQGAIWFTNYNVPGGIGVGGVTKFDGTIWTNYTTADGLVNNTVNDMVIDAQKNKWIATQGGGVSELTGAASWTTYNTNIDNNVHSVVLDGQGNKWFGTGGGLTEYDGSNWKTYTTGDGLINNHIMAIAFDKQGVMWIGTRGGGISQFNGTNWTTHDINNGQVNDTVLAIAVDAQNNVWAGGNHGVSMYNGTTWTTYDTLNSGIASDIVGSILIDGQSIWFGTGGMGAQRFAFAGRGVSVLSDITGIHEKGITANNILVCQNTSRDKVTIESLKEELNKIEIINLSGQLINSISTQGLKTQLNIDNLQSGMYLIRITTKDNEVMNKKMIKL